jgi:hypothetical protein
MVPLSVLHGVLLVLNVLGLLMRRLMASKRCEWGWLCSATHLFLVRHLERVVAPELPVRARSSN